MPSLAATVTQGVLPGALTVTLLPGVAVPETGGLRLATVPPLGGVWIVTVAGATTVKLLVAGVLLPPALVATAVTVLGPAGKVMAEVE